MHIVIARRYSFMCVGTLHTLYNAPPAGPPPPPSPTPVAPPPAALGKHLHSHTELVSTHGAMHQCRLQIPAIWGHGAESHQMIQGLSITPERIEFKLCRIHVASRFHMGSVLRNTFFQRRLRPQAKYARHRYRFWQSRIIKPVGGRHLTNTSSGLKRNLASGGR